MDKLANADTSHSDPKSREGDSRKVREGGGLGVGDGSAGGGQ
jgi:hypothetical protein